MYACVAATRDRARCRNFLEQQGQLCPGHQKELSEKGTVPMAPSPDVILMRININQMWRDRLEAGGISRKVVDWDKLEKEHVAQAERFRRAPYRFRQVADSGVPVFGPEGISHVSLLGLWKELAGKGFVIQDMHLKSRRDEKMSILVITLGRQKPLELTFSPEVALAVLPELLTTAYGFAHLWANPPDEQGRIVHTLNVSHREPEQDPRYKLSFNEGLWSATELSSA